MLGFFQLKNSGNNPSPLGDALAPTLELGEWYRQTSAGFQTGLQVAALGATSSFTTWDVALSVPDNEWWYVTSYRLSSPLVNAQSELLQLVPTYRIAPTGNAMFGFPGTFQRFDTEDPQNLHDQFAIWDATEPVWLPPGASIGFSVPQWFSTATVQVDGSIRFVRLPI